MKKIALLIGTILIASVGLVACSSKSNEAKSNNLLDTIKKEQSKSLQYILQEINNTISMI